MRIMLFLVVFTATQVLSAVALAKEPTKREIASEQLTCARVEIEQLQNEIPKCRSDRAVTTYATSYKFWNLCCVRD